LKLINKSAKSTEKTPSPLSFTVAVTPPNSGVLQVGGGKKKHPLGRLFTLNAL
jgi:hypothetical protein